MNFIAKHNGKFIYIDKTIIYQFLSFIAYDFWKIRQYSLNNIVHPVLHYNQKTVSSAFNNLILSL